MESVLELIFKTGAGKTFRLAIDDPKVDITPSEIQNAMNTVISKNIFDVEGGLTEIDSANIVTTETEPVTFEG